ncbi:MAG: AAA family ATPase [Polyangia bacterium]
MGSALLDCEQSLLSVIIAQLPVTEPAAASTSAADSGAQRVQPWEPEESLPPPLLHTVQSYGAQVERLVDGSVVLTLSGSGAARDLATQAGRCALVLARELPRSRVALATGRGQVRGSRGVPVGEVVERALELLRLQAQQDAADADTPRVLLDPVSSGLLPRRFRIESQPGLSLLLAEGEEYESRDPDSGSRTDPPCIGRDQELALLDSLVATAIEEPTARAALVVSAPGLGKSRLCQEFLIRLAAHHPEAVVLVGRGDPMTTASPYGVLAQAVRRLCGLTGKEPPAEQYHKLRQRLGRHLPSAARAHAVATLALLCSVEPTEPLPPSVAAARTSPPLWNQELTHGFCDFIAAECQDHPLVLILEDMHWCDGQTLRLIDLALHTLRETPLFVLGLARPEVEQLFPGLWAGRVQELRLTGLGKKASERLVRKVLAGRGDDKTIPRIVEQAAGNPLYIEELVRAVHEGKGDELPQSMLAMLQARLLRLEPGPRRLLRAASIFGHTFWRGGLLWLLGLRQAAPEQVTAVESWIKALLDAEIIERHRESRFPSDPEFGFRHVLMREAAYALLTDDDRKLGHGLVALYLEQAGERDQALVAGHTYRIVQYIRQRHSSFAVARLIMLTGLPLKKFTAATPDDPLVLRKIRSALAILLRGDELAELRELFRDTP